MFSSDGLDLATAHPSSSRATTNPETVADTSTEEMWPGQAVRSIAEAVLARPDVGLDHERLTVGTSGQRPIEVRMCKWSEVRRSVTE